MSGDRPPMKAPAAAGALVRELLKRRGMDARLEDYRAWQVWEEVVGPQIAARARPSRIREGVLEVRVDQPVWMQQLQLMKPAILGRLQQRLGSAAIRDIFLLRGRTPAPSPPSEPPLRPVPLDAEERAAVEAAVAAVPDAELRQRLRSLFTRQKQIDKARRS